MGWSLMQVGQQSKNNAMHSLADLSRQEQQRQNTNEQLENQHKQNIAGGVGAGASLGATIGSVVPGVGTVIGAGAGAIIGGLAAAYF